MLYSRILLLSCALVISNGVFVTANRLRISNGQNAYPGEFPFMVSAQYVKDSFHFCGGSIVNDKYVLLAYHCTILPHNNTPLTPDMVKIVVGVNNTNPDEVHNVTHIIRHYDYRTNDSFINDIALFKVFPPFKFSSKVAPVNLPKADFIPPVNLRAVVAGWGSTTFPAMTVTPQLKKTTVRVINNWACQMAYNSTPQHIHPTQMCTRPISRAPSGACPGDSGGPLVINKNTLIGIVSWSKKNDSCGSYEYPNVYTRVSDYIDWIYVRTNPSLIVFPDD